jgi:RNA polymerase sigma-70 factor (ECF subfamily)
LEELCRHYWTPLRQFIRSRGYGETEAEDITQEFLLHLLTHSTLRRADRSKGRFRSFLLGALANFLSHERERRSAQKRGGQLPHVSIEALGDGDLIHPPPVPDAEVVAFDRAWALAVVCAALEKIRLDYERVGKPELFALLRAFLPGGSAPPSYEDAAARASMNVAAFNSEVHRLRRRFRECVYEEVMGTVSAPHEIDAEIAHLYAVLMDRGTEFQPAPES